jgi:hypothetical protein
MTPSERLERALAHIAANEPKRVLVDTQELADEHGVPIGTIVLQRCAPVFLADAQLRLDVMRAKQLIRAGLIEWPDEG